MKKGMFKDRTMYTQRKVDPVFRGPTKEAATTGRFMAAGADYGTGTTVPLGKFKASNKGAIPYGCKTAKTEDVIQ